MSQNSLIIVESPTKAKTITKFLNSGNYNIISSYGHIRDLPKSSLGVDVEKNFKPHYITANAKAVKKVKQELKKADQLILATDEDREGEAIAWHLLYIAQKKQPKFKKNYQRIVFHEITEPAILSALKNPRKINMNLVNAQQARRVLDRLVGYKLSPFLWKKICKGLSAGRVQSVALRLICDREAEIKAFKPREYWSLEALVYPQKQKKQIFSASLIAKNEKKLGKMAIKNKKQINEIIQQLNQAKYKVGKIQQKQTKKNPLPPFTTSSLQQDAARRLHFSAKQTMMLAQKLYENGFITYHRTDSLNLSKNFLSQASSYLLNKFGEKYLQTRQFKTKDKRAQEAHEAIRPTNVKANANFKDKKINKLYDLIWQRALASQMTPAQILNKKIDINANNYKFRANGQTLKFDGFLKVYHIKISENILPQLEKGQNLDLDKLNPTQHFTKPPARYSEATLIKTLESEGIGRPSTYAPIISTVQARGYVKKFKGRFFPQDVGQAVNKILTKHFPKIVDTKFTAKMENNLDDIAQGEKEWQPVIKEFYKPFAKKLEKKYKSVDKVIEKTNKKCEKCGSPMIVKIGRYGKFLACSAFPKCKNAQPLDNKKKKKPAKKIGLKCPQCKKGEIVERKTRRTNKIFWGCSRFPKCKYATWNDPREKKT